MVIHHGHLSPLQLGEMAAQGVTGCSRLPAAVTQHAQAVASPPKPPEGLPYTFFSP